MKAEKLRYIVFLIDSKIKDHDGKIFCSLQDAKNYVIDGLQDNYSDKAVIGTFYIDLNHKTMLITKVQTFGFYKDKRNINQLELF